MQALAQGDAVAMVFIDIRPVSRGKGRSAPAAAAYRAGERLRDERTGQLYNFSRRRDVMHKEIVLPAAVSAAAQSWAGERQALWNAAEAAESRKDARVAREYLVLLPHELKAAARLELAQRFAQALVDRYGTAIDLAVHLPTAEGDPRNHHAHLLATTRVVLANGLGQKAALEQRMGLREARAEFGLLRRHWAEFANEALKAQGLDIHLDPRPLAEQGLQPRTVTLPKAVYYLERQGVRTQLGDWARAAGLMPESATPREARQETNLIDRTQAKARETWLRYRREELSLPPLQVERGAERRARPDEHRERTADPARSRSDYDLTD